jgi:hypothetical protein
MVGSLAPAISEWPERGRLQAVVSAFIDLVAA